MRKILIALLLSYTYSGFAGDKKYPVSELPDSLTRKANSVMRVYESRIIVNNLTSVVNKVHFAITILNENGDNYGSLIANYDKLQKVSGIEGAMYDASGNLVKKLKSKDILDLSATSEINLDDDNRVKAHHFYYNSYPYTVEYSYETNIHHTFYFPPWIPQGRDHFSVQQSIYELNIPADFGIRYKIFNTGEPVKKEGNGRISYTWQLNNRPAFEAPEKFSSWRNYQTAVFAAAKDFQLEKLKGNMETWKDFGLFQYQLVKDRDQLPDQVKTKVKELTANAQNRTEIINKLYNYLQQNTRYISIQLGIGGWQPYKAEYVASKGYGDCKALTNYMHSLLKEAGITSYFALVNGGDDDFSRNRVIEDFPSVQFNHVILCIPFEKDTTWLECTSQTLPAGYVSGFTANRKALLIREDGGFLVSTPKYGINENRQLRNTKIKLNENGDASITVETRYKGMRQDNLFGLINNVSKDKVKKFLSSAISISTYDLNNFKYQSEPSKLPSLNEDLNISASGLATITGKRIFITPNVMSKSGLRVEYDDKRNIDFTFDESWQDSSHTEITLPAGYTIESGINPVSITTEFGKYTMTCSLKENMIIYTRTFDQYSIQLPPSKQNEIVEFYNKIYKTDRSRLVLVKKEG